MSKQSEAKENQGYNPKPVLPICSNCKNYLSDSKEEQGAFGGVWHKEINIRCGIGGFAIKKQGNCKLHEPK
jgi:hypothetical protein